ncbi:MAG TPA: helix-turn-helix domain-containing protein [Pseudonocardia sp.]|jgi:AcrR family transcriptional regulator
MSSQPTEGVRAATRKLPRDARREQTLRAAREVFVEHGLAGARAKDIAERAGITESHLFRHFSSKDEIYSLAMEVPLLEAFDELIVDLKAIAERVAGNHRDFILGFNERTLNFYLEHGPMLGVTFFSDLRLGRALYQGALRERWELLGRLVAKHSGLNKPGLDADVVRRAMFGPPWAIAYAHRLRGIRMDVPSVAESLVRMETVGLREARETGSDAATRIQELTR